MFWPSVLHDFNKLANSFHTSKTFISPHKHVIDTSVCLFARGLSKIASFLSSRVSQNSGNGLNLG